MKEGSYSHQIILQLQTKERIQIKKSAGITAAAKHELLSPELDNDTDTSSFTIWSITLESFAYVDGVLQSTGTGIETNALIGEEPVAIGHRKQVQMVLPS